MEHIVLALFTGNSPLTAKMFMVAVDQVIVNEQLPCFTKALVMMFCSYYLHNIDYPVALAATGVLTEVHFQYALHIAFKVVLLPR